MTIVNQRVVEMPSGSDSDLAYVILILYFSSALHYFYLESFNLFTFYPIYLCNIILRGFVTFVFLFNYKTFVYVYGYY